MAKRRAHGGGRFDQTADARWRGAISTTEGRRCVSGRTRREAVQRLVQARTQQTASRELLAHYLAAWLEHARTVVTRRTADGYADHIRLYVVPAIGDVPLADLSPEHVQRMPNELPATGAIAVPASVVREIAKHRDRQLVERDVAGTRWVETGLVFVTAHGTPLDGHRLTRQLHRILAKADLPDHRWHDLRHSCRSILAANGVPLPEIQRILGHAEIATTGIDQRSLTDAQRAAAARMQDVLFGGFRD